MKKSLRISALLALTSLLLACQVVPGGIPAASTRLEAQSAAATSVWKRQLQNDYSRIFDENDSNHDGRIELAEIPYAPRAFAALDKDHNGSLSRQEALPDTQHLQYLTDYMIRNLKNTGAAAAGEDPQLDTLPGPAELDAFATEITRPIQGMATSRHKIPVLLVPGYAEPSWYFMSGLYKDLKADGWAVEGINLFPNFASAEEQAQKIKSRIEDMKRRLGVDKVNLVVHSFGGLISRYYIQHMGGDAVVQNLVTVATPHLGTYTAYLGPGDSAVQLRPNSNFLQDLNRNGFAYPPVKYTSIWTNLDEIVIPAKNAIMPDSTVRYVPWTGHLTIMFSKRTYKFVREALAE